MPDEERFLYWDKFGRPKDAVASFEYLTDGLARVIDTWWFDDVSAPQPAPSASPVARPRSSTMEGSGHPWACATEFIANTSCPKHRSNKKAGRKTASQSRLTY